MKKILFPLILALNNLEATTLDDFTSYSFNIQSDTVMNSETHLESDVSTPFGIADVFFHVSLCTMTANSSGLNIVATNLATGSFGIEYRFDNPVNLCLWDFLQLRQTHSQSLNRISGIYLFLPDFKSLELENLVLAPFENDQERYPLYQFESSDNFVYLPKKVSSIAIEFSIQNMEIIDISSLSLETVGPRQDLDSHIESGGSRDVIIKTERVILDGEIVRLEASFDLEQWFEKSNYLEGTGQVVSFEKSIDDGNYYRFQWHPKVERSEVVDE